MRSVFRFRPIALGRGTQEGFKLIEAALPGVALLGEPRVDHAELVGKQAVRANAAALGACDQAGRFEHREVLNERRQAHVKRLGEVADGTRAVGETFDDLPAHRVRQRVQGSIDRRGNHAGSGADSNT